MKILSNPIADILNEMGLFNTMARMKKSRFTYNIMMKFWEIPPIYTPESNITTMDGGITTLTLGYPYTTTDVTGIGATTMNLYRTQ